MNGKPAALADIPTRIPDTQVKGARVIGCEKTHRDTWYAERHGGVIETGIDAAITAVTDLQGKRKLVIAWTPGKTMLSNAKIPCIHADPYYGDIKPGTSAEATGIIIFSEESLDKIVKHLLKQGIGKPKLYGYPISNHY